MSKDRFWLLIIAILPTLSALAISTLFVYLFFIGGPPLPEFISPILLALIPALIFSWASSIYLLFFTKTPVKDWVFVVLAAGAMLFVPWIWMSPFAYDIFMKALVNSFVYRG